jgi:hypothetical protein
LPKQCIPIFDGMAHCWGQTYVGCYGRYKMFHRWALALGSYMELTSVIFVHRGRETILWQSGHGRIMLLQWRAVACPVLSNATAELRRVSYSILEIAIVSDRSHGNAGWHNWRFGLFFLSGGWSTAKTAREMILKPWAAASSTRNLQ